MKTHIDRIATLVHLGGPDPAAVKVEGIASQEGHRTSWRSKDLCPKPIPQSVNSKQSATAARFGVTESWWDFGVAILSRGDLPAPTNVVKHLPCPKHLPYPKYLPCPQAKGSRYLSTAIGRLRIASPYAPYLSQPRKAEAIRRRVTRLQHLRTHLRNQDLADGESVLGGDFLGGDFLGGDFKVKADDLPKPDRGHHSEDERREFSALCRERGPLREHRP